MHDRSIVRRIAPAAAAAGRLVTWLLTTVRGLRSRLAGEYGQTTAEYALVILGAAAIATLLITWATKSHAVTDLFDSVVSKIMP